MVAATNNAHVLWCSMNQGEIRESKLAPGIVEITASLTKKLCGQKTSHHDARTDKVQDRTDSAQIELLVPRQVRCPGKASMSFLEPSAKVVLKQSSSLASVTSLTAEVVITIIAYPSARRALVKCSVYKVIEHHLTQTNVVSRSFNNHGIKNVLQLMHTLTKHVRMFNS